MSAIVRRLDAVLVGLVRRIVQAFTGESRPWQGMSSASAKTSQSVKPGRPAEHLGATETFGSELRALRDLEVSPELVSEIETELRWGLIWNEFERTMQAEIDRIFAPYLPEPECRDFDDLREKVGLQELEADKTPPLATEPSSDSSPATST